MPYSFDRTFAYQFDQSLGPYSYFVNSIPNITAFNADSSSIVTDIEYVSSSNNKNSISMKNGVEYKIVVDFLSKKYFGPYPNGSSGTDWVFCIDYFSTSFGSIVANQQSVTRRRMIACQAKVSLDASTNEYVIFNDASSNRFSEFFIFEESTDSPDINSIHFWIRKNNSSDYYKFKTENFSVNKWTNLVISMGQPAIPAPGNNDPTESYFLKIYVNCQELTYSIYGEAPSQYSNGVEYFSLPSPENCFDFVLNSRCFGDSFRSIRLSSLVNEVSCFNRRSDGFEDRPYFTEKDVFDIYNYGIIVNIFDTQKVTGGKFLIKSSIPSTVRVLCAEGSSEGQYLGLSDGRLLESKESVWQYSKLLNSQESLNSINVIGITNNFSTVIVPGSGIKFTGSIVELE